MTSEDGIKPSFMSSKLIVRSLDDSEMAGEERVELSSSILEIVILPLNYSPTLTKMEEGERLELSRPFDLTVFKTAAIAVLPTLHITTKTKK